CFILREAKVPATDLGELAFKSQTMEANPQLDARDQDDPQLLWCSDDERLELSQHGRRPQVLNVVQYQPQRHLERREVGEHPFSHRRYVEVRSRGQCTDRSRPGCRPTEGLHDRDPELGRIRFVAADRHPGGVVGPIPSRKPRSHENRLPASCRPRYLRHPRSGVQTVEESRSCNYEPHAMWRATLLSIAIHAWLATRWGRSACPRRCRAYDLPNALRNTAPDTHQGLGHPSIAPLVRSSNRIITPTATAAIEGSWNRDRGPSPKGHFLLAGICDPVAVGATTAWPGSNSLVMGASFNPERVPAVPRRSKPSPDPSGSAQRGCGPPIPATCNVLAPPLLPSSTGVRAVHPRGR